MVHCIIAHCTSHQSHVHNGRSMVFFMLPVKPTERVYRKDKHRNWYNNVKKCQCEAWITAINRGYENGNYLGCADVYNIRICIHHFHPSVINFSSNECALKIGAAPTMCLTQFSLENDIFKEEKTLQRIVGSADDMEHIYNYEMRSKPVEIETFPCIVTSTREDRHDKRRCELAQTEKAKKTAYTQSNVIVNLRHLNETFPNTSSVWEKLYFEKFIKLRRNLTTASKMHSAMQEVIIFEDECTKSYSMRFSAPKSNFSRNFA